PIVTHLAETSPDYCEIIVRQEFKTSFRPRKRQLDRDGRFDEVMWIKRPLAVDLVLQLVESLISPHALRFDGEGTACLRCQSIGPTSPFRLCEQLGPVHPQITQCVNHGVNAGKAVEDGLVEFSAHKDGRQGARLSLEARECPLRARDAWD